MGHHISASQAVSLGLLEPKATYVKPGERTHTEQLFDASRIFDYEDISNAVMLSQHKLITAAGTNYLQLQSMLDEVNRELHDHIVHCNRIAWSAHDWKITRAPTRSEQARVPSMLEEAGSLSINWANKARKAHEARLFVEALSEAVEAARTASFKGAEQRAERDREQELRAEFDAQEKSEREARYQEWRANR